MGASDRTKQLLAAGLQELAATMPFRKIRVSELCEHCGIDRRTFYYHFRDIYDLAAWTFDQTMNGNLPDDEGRFRHSGLVRTLECLWKGRAFYRRALEEDSQNALGRYIMDRAVRTYEAAIRAQKKGEDLTERERFAIRYHSVGSLTMLRRWLLTDRGPEPEEIATRLALVMPQLLRELYQMPQEETQTDATNTGGTKHE